MFIRFLIAFFALSAIYPHRMKVTDRKHELYFAAAGLCGTTLYFLLENFALTYTTASNVGIIISVIPFFTAVLSYFVNGEKLKWRFFIGFVIAMIGISLISLNGRELKLNPLGDFLTVLAAAVWSVYAVLTKKISGFQYHTIQTTRRTFLYGIVFMIPFLFAFHGNRILSGWNRLANLPDMLNLFYLGLFASALCFVTWNMAVERLGPVKISVYSYLNPVITIAASSLFLHEKITGLIIAGTMLDLVGLLISQDQVSLRIRRKTVAASAVKESEIPEETEASSGIHNQSE